MRWLGKSLVTLLLLLILAMITIYVVMQTNWGAHQLSQWLSNNSRYQVQINNIKHSWSQPKTLAFSDIVISNKQHTFTLAAQVASFDFNWQQLTAPRHFHRLLLQQGQLTIKDQRQSLPFSANILQLNQMAIQSENADWQIQGQNITGGITPWNPQPNELSGSGKFQFSAEKLKLNGIPLEKVIMQGDSQQNALIIHSLGATLAQGSISGNGQRLPDGSWQWDSLLISNVRWQTPMTLKELWLKVSKLPAISIKDLSLTNAKLEGKNWSANYLDASVKNIGLTNGSWQTKEGIIDFNVMDTTLNDLHFTDAIGHLRLAGNELRISNLTTRWEKGLFHVKAQWDHQTKQLNITNATVAGLTYTLPENWHQSLKESLPKWISEFSINQLTINNSLLIDINPDFPFQLTALNGHIDNMELLKEGKWGIWNGSSNLSATSATFNKVELHRPYLKLHTEGNKLILDQLDASIDDGLLKIKGTVDQQVQKPFTLDFRGIDADLAILPQWGWIPLKLQGKGNFTLLIQGDLSANDIKNTINGTFIATDKQSGQETQIIDKGQISTPNCETCPVVKL
ncbi:AsmA family protein [Photorhabdus cinerea]|uniref:AsmA family protein n=2 Tax=Photorhabdus cinerea TaxID=471575 RepID=A0A7X5QG14_9GAMM|nr:AsmA family protein [Photorhabdus cinerea]NHB93656.1 AsmA family protein [Photorhabdus cinerea]